MASTDLGLDIQFCVDFVLCGVTNLAKSPKYVLLLVPPDVLTLITTWKWDTTMLLEAGL